MMMIIIIVVAQPRSKESTLYMSSKSMTVIELFKQL